LLRQITLEFIIPFPAETQRVVLAYPGATPERSHRRVSNIDIETCAHRQGPVKIIAAATHPTEHLPGALLLPISGEYLKSIEKSPYFSGPVM